MSPVIIWGLKLLGLALAAGGIFIAHKKFKFKDDNVVEKVVETEIKAETGISIDLENIGEDKTLPMQTPVSPIDQNNNNDTPSSTK